MVKSQTKIKKQTEKKTNPELVETINTARKNKNWTKVAEILSSSRRNRKNKNISEIDEKAEEGDEILVVGKVLSQGEINKKIKIIALNYSEKAKEKLLKAGCKISSILDEIKKNPEMKGLKVLK